jgi:ornithine cyclodeaminase
MAPEVILSSDNVVDDVDHVARAQTSIHLAEQVAGNRHFVRCTLAEVLLGRHEPRRDTSRIVVFSPFGLGVLDLAVGQMVLELARGAGRYTAIDSFLPAHWIDRH